LPGRGGLGDFEFRIALATSEQLVMLRGEIMLKKYMPKKDVGFGLLFLVAPLISWFLLLLITNIFILLLSLIVTIFFLWVWFGTYYQLDDEYFMYQSGPLKKKIPINKIVKVNKNVRSFFGMRPALSFEYLQIKYNTYDEVFIAPKDEDKFITDLINKNLKITIE
jgi:hypothetical protein